MHVYNIPATVDEFPAPSAFMGEEPEHFKKDENRVITTATEK
jgi:hypothetical protein